MIIPYIVCYNICEVITVSEVTYKDGYGFIDGYKFRKDDKTGYYLSTKKIGVSRMRLHVYVWQKHNGKIPDGMEINHIDENKDNNEINNLECLTRKQHLAYHKEHDYNKMLPKWRKNLDKNARPAAAQWHRTLEGRQVNSDAHRGKKIKKRYIKRCKNCGKVYRAAFSRSKFCSPACQSAFRKKSGVDDEIRHCLVCGKSFKVNKYSKKDVCSEKCRNKKRLIQSKIQTRGTTKLKSGKFIGQVSFCGHKYHTSTFKNEDDAHNARNDLIVKLLKQ